MSYRQRLSHLGLSSLVCLMSTLAVPPSAMADTVVYHVKATAGFETGIVRLASIDGTLARLGNDATVNWGDGTTTPALYANCEGAANFKNCDILGTHIYRSATTYTITIHYELSSITGPKPETATTTATIVPVGDFVILSIGDSVASGEGSPVVPLTTTDPAQWDDVPANDPYKVCSGDLSTACTTDQQCAAAGQGHCLASGGSCHRSSGAGPALAAAKIQTTNNVTFIHVACSGAHIEGGNVPTIINQLKNTRAKLPRIDVLLISGGANDVNGGFGNVIGNCVDPTAGGFGFCNRNDQFEMDMDRSIAELPAKYDDLSLAIDCLLPGPGGGDPVPDPACEGKEQPVPPLVLITEYFDPTHNNQGEFPTAAQSVTCVGFTIAPKEWEYLYNAMVVPLNEKVRDAATRHGWVLGDMIQSAFLEHGYCASAGPGAVFGDSWVVKLPGSLADQGNKDGTGHPNHTGQGVYRDRIYARVIDYNPPVTTASATAGGQPYMFGSLTTEDVEVTLSATNGIKESGVGATYYAIDDPSCTPDDVGVTNCMTYSGPFTIDTDGRHTVTYFSKNTKLGFEQAHTVEVYIDNTPPTVTCSAAPPLLWPPNGKLVPVTNTVKVEDAGSGPAGFVLLSTATSEGDPDLAIRDFEVGTPDTEGSLRARRRGNGPGRIYTFVYQGMDIAGNTATCELEVRVPHDRRDMRRLRRILRRRAAAPRASVQSTGQAGHGRATVRGGR